MSRVAKNPVTVPAGVEVKFGTEALVIKGKNGELSFPLHSDVAIELNDGKLTFAAKNDSKQANAMSGTARALVNNMVKGVSEGFEKKLQLIGVGYRAQAQGKVLNLSLGFSHRSVYGKCTRGKNGVDNSRCRVWTDGVGKHYSDFIAGKYRTESMERL